jgi:hypothetical protein
VQADASETAGIKGTHPPIEHKSDDGSPLDQRARLGAINEGEGGHGACMTDAGLFFINMG